MAADEKDMSSLKKVADNMKKVFGKASKGEKNDPCEPLREEMSEADRAAAVQLLKVIAAMVRGGPAAVAVEAAKLLPLIIEFEKAKKKYFDCLVANNNPKKAEQQKELKELQSLRAQFTKEKDKLA